MSEQTSSEYFSSVGNDYIYTLFENVLWSRLAYSPHICTYIYIVKTGALVQIDPLTKVMNLV